MPTDTASALNTLYICVQRLYFNRIPINIRIIISPGRFVLVLRRWIGLKLITINLPEPYLKDLDELVGEDLYPNRAEVIRTAVRDLLAEEVWDKKRKREDV